VHRVTRVRDKNVSTVPAPYKSNMSSFGYDQAIDRTMPDFSFGYRPCEEKFCGVRDLRFEYHMTELLQV